MADEVLCLPMHHELTEADLERVIGLIMEVD
jgi:dTDP-4-amino-4,6-dideoxygalactose transaminase